MCFFFTLFGYWLWGGGGSPQGLVHNLLLQFFSLGKSKSAVSDTYFFHTVTTQNDHATYAKQHSCVFLHVMWVLAAGRGGGGFPRDWYTTCLCSFSLWAAQKFRFLKLTFFDIVTTQNDHPTYLKHASGSIYGFPHFFGMVCGSQGIGTQPAFAVFHPRHCKNCNLPLAHVVYHPGHLQNSSFRNLFFLIL